MPRSFCYEKICNGKRSTNEAILDFTEFIIQTPLRAQPREKAYHYTDGDVFERIVSEGMRLTSFDRIKGDKEEGILMKKVWNKACYEVFRNGKIDKSFYEKLKSYELEQEYNVYMRHKEGDRLEHFVCDVYIGSFSKSENDKRMWRKYCKKTKKKGINFDLNPTQLNTPHSPFTIEFEDISLIEVVDVIYDRKKLVEFLKIAIIFFRDIVDEKPDFVDTNIKSILNRMRFSYKNKKFRWEHETRIILKIPKRHRGSIDSNNEYAWLPLNQNCYFTITGGPKLTDEELKIFKDSLSKKWSCVYVHNNARRTIQ